MLLNDLVYDTVKHLKAQDFDSSLIDFSIETASNFSEEHGVLNADHIAEFYVLSFLGCGSGVILVDRKNVRELKFGVSELTPMISASDVVLTTNKKTDERVISQLTINNIRGESIHDKRFENFLYEDLLLIRTALGLSMEGVEIDNLSEGIIETVQENHKEDIEFEDLKKVPVLQMRVSSFVNEVMSVYDETFALGYQLDPFVGVIVEEVHSVMIVRKFEQSILPSTLASYLGRAVREEMKGVSVSYERQINLRQIYESNVTVYFPRKIIEFALGYKITDNLEVPTYQKIAKRVWRNNSKSDNPISSYSHREAIAKYITELAWGLLGIVRDENNLQEVIENTDKIPLSIDLTDLFTAYLKRLKDSLCTFAILKGFSGTLDDWSSLDVIVSTPVGIQSKQLIPKIYGDVLKSKGQIYSPSVKQISGCDISFYTHIVDEEIAEAEPLWAYVALQVLQESGETLSKENFLIGRDNNGKILMSSPTSMINLSKHLIHVLISGSRSGKGVQTYNQLATTLASNIPVFYGDRKPDTAVELYRIAGGADHRGTPKGYYVNGGSYDRKYVSPDVRDELDWDTGKVATRWQNTTPSFWCINSYVGLLGDMVYLRHILLTLGILVLRSQAEAKDPDLYKMLNGKGGVAIVYDEMSNWHVGFMAKYMNSSKYLSNQNLTNEKDLESLRDALRTINNPKSTEKQIDGANDVVSNSKKDTFLRGLYMRDLLENLNTTLDVLSEKRDAGFVGSESVYSNIYIIGQQMAFKNTDKRAYTFTKGSGYAEKVDDGDDYLSRFLHSFDADFIMGYNDDADRKNYAWRSVSGSDSKKYLTQNARKFGYFEGVSFEQLRQGNPKEVDLASERRVVYYKPYLILNSNEWESESVSHLRKALGDKFDSVMAKHIQPDGKLHEGIGFEGYIKMLGGNPAQSLIKAREIADMVVRKMGYDGDYLDFLMDLRPEWNFSAKDVWDAFLNPEIYKKRRSFEYWNRYQTLMYGGEEESEPTVTGRPDVVYGQLDDENDFESADSFGDLESGDGLDDLGNTVSFDELESEGGFGSDEFGDVNDSDGENDYIDDDFDLVDKPITQNASVSEPIKPIVYAEVGDFNEDEVWSVPEHVEPAELPNNKTVRSAIVDLARSLGVSEDVLSSAVAKVIPPKVDYISMNRREQINRGDVLDEFPQSRFNVRNEYTDVYEVGDYVTSKIVADYGGLERIERISVKGGYLAINGVRYAKSFKNIPVSSLPVDKQVHLRNKQYAELFDFSILRDLPNLSILKFDSNQFVIVRVLNSVGLMADDSVFKMFDYIKSLRELTVGSHSFTREEAFKNLAENENIFFSARRRSQVIGRFDKFSRDYRKSRWDSTKRHWETSHGRKRFFGVTGNVVGATLGYGMLAGAKSAKLVQDVVHGGKRLFNEFNRKGWK